MSTPIILPFDAELIEKTGAILLAENALDESVVMTGFGEYGEVLRAVRLASHAGIASTRIVFSDAWSVVVPNHAAVHSLMPGELFSSAEPDQLHPMALRPGTLVGVAASSGEIENARGWTANLIGLSFAIHGNCAWVPALRVEPCELRAPFVVVSTPSLVVNGVVMEQGT